LIWIITSPEQLHEEEQIIVALLSAGASRVLLRKPDWTMEQYRKLLDKINPGCYDRIIIRDQPGLATGYGLAGIHWSSTASALYEAQECSRMNADGKKNSSGTGRTSSSPEKLFTHSTGIHSAAEITQTATRYTTLLLSPVFDSISKPGYHGRAGGMLFNKDNRPVLALGGVDHNNIIFLKQWQFDGAALLGAIWKTPAKAVENYYRIQQLWNKSDLT
jgi:thiamine-phosphate pyrophosphorylase